MCYASSVVSGNPFVFQRPVDDLIDREAELARLLEALLELVRGHPQRAILMAHYLWEHTPAKQSATLTEWQAALDEVTDSLAEGFERFLDLLPALQVRVLFALALSPHGLNSNYTQARYGLPEGGAATDAREALVRRGEVLRKPHRITDPLLGHWLRQRRRPPGL